MAADQHVPRPSDVPADLTRADGQYRAMVAVVLFALGAFVAVYLGLAALCVDQIRVAVQLVSSGSDLAVLAGIACVPAVVLLILLTSGLFGISRATADPMLVEILPNEQPRLFAFVHGIADAVGAPRPKRVFASMDVNASVTFDASVLNLVLPTQKNLVIGLGLVNALDLDELEAVLAHEFGHFSQSSMRLGSYVYVAQQVVVRLVHHRGWLDTAVGFVSGIDIRIAWLGWLGAALMWAARTVLDLMLFLVQIPTRALTRRMEFHADKVAVSLTGSDSLIHALYRLGFAEMALQEALAEIAERARAGRFARDLFAHQTEAMGTLRRRMGDPDLGRAPARPDGPEAASHRVFEDDDAPPPQMWSTHPSNALREEAAKRPYLRSHLDPRPGWVIFDDPAAIRHAVTDRLNRIGCGMPDGAVPEDDTAPGAGVVALEPRYRGLYGAIRVGASAPTAEGCLLDEDVPPAGADVLYGESLAVEVDVRRTLLTEFKKLHEVCRGDRTLPEAGLLHRGDRLRRADLVPTAERVQAECVEADRALDHEVRRIRTAVRACARELGPHHLQRHTDAVRWVHFVEHTSEALGRAQHTLHDVLHRASQRQHDETSIRAVIDELDDVWTDLVAAYVRLEGVSVPHGFAPDDREVRAVVFEEPVGPRPDPVSWDPAWVDALVTTAGHAMVGVGDLRRHALDVLLRVEDAVLEAWPDGPDADAPEPLELPEYPTHPVDPGSELASILIPEPVAPMARWRAQAGPIAMAAVAVALLSAMGAVRLYTGAYRLILYNGAAVPAVATVNGVEHALGPRSTDAVLFPWTRTVELGGRLGDWTLDAVTVDLGAEGEVVGVYNVGRRGVLARYQYVWSRGGDVEPNVPPVLVGNPVFVPARGERYVLEEPPAEKRVKGDAPVRAMVLGDVGDALGDMVLGMLDDDGAAALAEARLLTEPVTMVTSAGIERIPVERRARVVDAVLLRAPQDLHSHRLRQDASLDPDVLLPDYEARARSGRPDDLYLLARLLTDPARSAALLDQVLAADPEHELAVCARGMDRVRLGDATGADADLARCVELDPDAADRVLLPRLIAARMLGGGERAARLLDGTDPLRGYWRAALAADADPTSLGDPQALNPELRAGLLLAARRYREALDLGLQSLPRDGLFSVFAALALDDGPALDRLLDELPVDGSGASVHVAMVARLRGHASAEARRAALTPASRRLLDAVDPASPAIPATRSLSDHVVGVQLAAMAGSAEARALSRTLVLPSVGLRYEE